LTETKAKVSHANLLLLSSSLLLLLLLLLLPLPKLCTRRSDFVLQNTKYEAFALRQVSHCIQLHWQPTLGLYSTKISIQFTIASAAAAAAHRKVATMK